MSEPRKNDPTSPAGSESNPLRWLHSMLRGRYHWAIPLAVILGVGGAFAGYSSIGLTYQSQGSLRVGDASAGILSERSGSSVSSSNLASSHARLIRSQRVADMAMRSERWQQLEDPAENMSQAAFRSAINAYSNSEYITVNFVHRNPDVARVGVRSVIEAFERLVREQSLSQDTRRLQILRDRASAAESDVNSIENRMAEVTGDLGAQGLSTAYSNTLVELGRTESNLEEARLRLATAKNQPELLLDGSDPAAGNGSMSPQQRRRMQLVQRQDDLRLELDQLRVRFGDRHRRVRQVRDQIEVIEEAIAQLPPEGESTPRASGQMLSQPGGLNGSTGGNSGGGESGNGQAGSDPASALVTRIQEQVNSLEQRYNQLKNEVASLAERNSRLTQLSDERSAARATLDQATDRIDQISLESDVDGRTSPTSYGDTPTPANQDQKLQFALLGAIGGVMLGTGLALLPGLLRPNFRHFDEVTLYSGHAPLLGMLPTLPEHNGSAEDASRAGQCLHGIRTRLQLDHINQGRRVLIVSGPNSGTGKTSMTLSLGISFANSGARTLLIDFDIIGGRLSRRLEARRHKRLGYLLRQRGLVDENRIQQLIRDRNGHEQPLGELLREHGVVTPESLEQTLARQSRTRVGIFDAMEGEPLEHCVQPTAIQGLNILPLGDAREQDAPRLNARSTHDLIAKLRDDYDVILIDSGPAPGSVETPIIAAAVDAAVLVISRGERRGGLQECANFFREIGVRVAGVVFNRAEVRDFERSSYSRSQSVRSRPRTDESDDDPMDVQTDVADRDEQSPDKPAKGEDRSYGSMADAVLDSTR